MKILSNAKKLVVFSAATTLPILSLTAASWTNDTTGTFDWTDASNWSTNPSPAPGVTGSAAGETADLNIGGTNINTVVNLATSLPVSTGNIRVDASQGATASTILNINSGGVLNANNANNTLLSINEGGSNNAGAVATININTGGSIETGQIRLGRDDGTSTLNVAGGSLNMTGGGDFAMRSDKNADGTATSVFQMSAGTFTSGGSRSLILDTNTSQVKFSGTADFDGQNLTARVGAAEATGTALIELTGSNIARADFNAIDAYGVDNVANTFTLGFVADAVGVSTLNTINELDLVGSGIQTDADLSLDLTAYTGGPGTITLASYGSLVGTFGNINVIGGAGTIDYGTGTNDAITFNVVPEPATYALLFGVTGLAMGVIRRRKNDK